MSEDRLTIGDYPLAEKRPEIVRGKRGVMPDTAWLFAQATGTTP